MQLQAGGIAWMEQTTQKFRFDSEEESYFFPFPEQLQDPSNLLSKGTEARPMGGKLPEQEAYP
jgi:hypothetical protein